MSRKKSIESRIKNKTLKDIRNELRFFEKGVIADATRAAGEIGVAIFREDPEHQIFQDYPQFREKISELSDVLGRINVKISKRENGTDTGQKNNPVSTKKENDFVRDIRDEEL
ncbi:MAG: hypothetical protein RBR06_01910 [Desulfuromonadaceae bacterium]|nr:hypothetical protein [Desulfuromonadaceae bacterium]